MVAKRKIGKTDALPQIDVSIKGEELKALVLRANASGTTGREIVLGLFKGMIDGIELYKCLESVAKADGLTSKQLSMCYAWGAIRQAHDRLKKLEDPFKGDSKLQGISLKGDRIHFCEPQTRTPKTTDSAVKADEGKQSEAVEGAVVEGKPKGPVSPRSYIPLILTGLHEVDKAGTKADAQAVVNELIEALRKAGFNISQDLQQAA